MCEFLKCTILCENNELVFRDIYHFSVEWAFHNNLFYNMIRVFNIDRIKVVRIVQ